LSSTTCDGALLAAGTLKYGWILGFAAASVRHMAAHSSDESLAEIAEILAAGLMRLRARKSSPKSADLRECSVDFTPDQSGHAIGVSQEVVA
jgi:hypothetical protein